MTELEAVRRWLREHGHAVDLLDRATQEGAAALLGVNPRTLRRWSELGIGPPVTAVGPFHRRRYRVADLAGWIADQADQADKSGIPDIPGRGRR